MEREQRAAGDDRRATGSARVQVTPQLPHGILGGWVPLVRGATRPGHRNRRGDALVAVLDAALADAVAAATRRSRIARSRHLEYRRLAFGPRAPPSRS
jgi:hypothetical protein